MGLELRVVISANINSTMASYMILDTSQEYSKTKAMVIASF